MHVDLHSMPVCIGGQETLNWDVYDTEARVGTQNFRVLWWCLLCSLTRSCDSRICICGVVSIEEVTM